MMLHYREQTACHGCTSWRPAVLEAWHSAPRRSVLDGCAYSNCYRISHARLLLLLLLPARLIGMFSASEARSEKETSLCDIAYCRYSS